MHHSADTAQQVVVALLQALAARPAPHLDVRRQLGDVQVDQLHAGVVHDVLHRVLAQAVVDRHCDRIGSAEGMTITVVRDTFLL